MSTGDGAPFVDFLDAIDVELEAGQRVACKVCFDGVDPVDLVGEEREWAAKLFGPVETIPALARDTIAWVCGGRSGKTYLFNLRGLHLALTIDLSELAPGEEAFVAIIAPTLELAQQGLRYAAGAAKKHPDIRRLIALAPQPLPPMPPPPKAGWSPHPGRPLPGASPRRGSQQPSAPRPTLTPEQREALQRDLAALDAARPPPPPALSDLADKEPAE